MVVLAYLLSFELLDLYGFKASFSPVIFRWILWFLSRTIGILIYVSHLSSIIKGAPDIGRNTEKLLLFVFFSCIIISFLRKFSFSPLTAALLLYLDFKPIPLSFSCVFSLHQGAWMGLSNTSFDYRSNFSCVYVGSQDNWFLSACRISLREMLRNGTTEWKFAVSYMVDLCRESWSWLKVMGPPKEKFYQQL